jgi:uncharacterized repeat protein (TIGR02543 family)
MNFDAGGGTFKNSSDEIRNDVSSENAGILPRMPSMSNPGYRFVGWYDEDGINRRDNFKTDRNITLTARWVEEPPGFKVGDMDGDGRITSADATVIAKWLVTDPEHRDPDFCQLTADISGTGYVSIADVILLARWLVGLNVNGLISH